MVNANERPIQNGMYTTLKSGNHLYYWSNSFLEDADMFYSPVGYRLDNAGIKLLQKAGYTIEVKTIEQQKQAFEQNELETKQRLQADLDKRGVIAEAKKTAEMPEKVDFPEGEELEDKKFPINIYGGGIWYIIQPETIWVVENNGSDGDDWSQNNVKTGGAGAIGWKCKKTPELENAVRAISKKN